MASLSHYQDAIKISKPYKLRRFFNRAYKTPPFFALFQKSQKSVFWQLRQNGTFDLNEIWYAVGAQGGLSGVSNMNQIGSVLPELVLKI